ncbi:MAG: diguanylate cyclase [Myxococcota bacterium]|jgi:diguanylate cyclase
MQENTAAAFKAAPTEERALDVLGSILKIFGRYGFDVPDDDYESMSERFEAWSRHALIGTPAPGPPQESRDTRRRWRALTTAFESRRKAERELVVTRVGAALRAVNDLANGLKNIFARDETIDLRIQKHLMEIEKAAATGDPADLLALVPSALADIRVVLAERRRTVRERLAEMGEAMGAMRADLNQARQEADTDALTRLHNHRAFVRTFDQMILLAEGSGEPLVLVLLDVDHFKRFNDSHGHKAGDAVLEGLADNLIRTFPRRHDFVARYGGEEFAILLADVDAKTAQTLVNRMLRNVRDMIVPHGRTAHKVTVSAGFTMLRPSEPANHFFERADRALYQAKTGGRDRSTYLP